jgi:hypothetical protein
LPNEYGGNAPSVDSTPSDYSFYDFTLTTVDFDKKYKRFRVLSKKNGAYGDTYYYGKKDEWVYLEERKIYTMIFDLLAKGGKK